MRPNIGQFHRAGMSHNTTEYAQRWLRKRLFAQPGLIHPESAVAWHVYRSIAKRCSPETQNKKKKGEEPPQGAAGRDTGPLNSSRHFQVGVARPYPRRCASLRRRPIGRCKTDVLKWKMEQGETNVAWIDTQQDHLP